MSIRDKILAADDRGRVEINIPQWGTSVVVMSMTGRARASWAEMAFDDDGKLIMTDMKSRLLVHCLYDAEGNLLFTADDVSELEKKRGDILVHLWTIARKLNGMGAEAEEEDTKK